MEKTIVAAAVSALTNDQRLIARDAGFQFAKNQLANIETASTYAAMLGTDPTLDSWEAARIDWVSGYVDANPNNTGNAADKAWQRFADLLDNLFGMVKPKSANPAAEKKRAEREKKALEITARIRSTNNPGEMMQIAVSELQQALGATRTQIYIRQSEQDIEEYSLQKNGSNSEKGSNV